MIFETIQNELAAHAFEIVAHDHNRPWGGFFVIAEAQAQAFVDAYFEGLDG
jgi:mannose-6-phosphate isomerase